MGNDLKAIDIMYYVATPEFIHKWNEAKKGELICRMERAIGGLPQYESIEAMIAKMDEAGVDKVFITQCKMWSYWNKWMYMDTTLDEVAQYTKLYPDRFVGLAGYNPFRIKESLEELERAVKDASLSPFPAVPGKRSARLAFTTELRGSGAAGTPPDYSILFRGCGMAETIVGGTSVTYAPSSDVANFTRLCLTAYIDGLRVMYLGCMGTFTISCPLDGVPAVAWEFTAADFAVADAPLAAGTAYDAQLPEPVLAAGFSFGGFHFDAASVTFAMNNALALRESANATGGHIGALLTGRAPSGAFDPEAVLRGTEDLFAKWEGGDQLALSIQIGRAAGNICTVTAPKCQYAEVGFADRGGILAYEAPFRMARDTGDDEISIQFT